MPLTTNRQQNPIVDAAMPLGVDEQGDPQITPAHPSEKLFESIESLKVWLGDDPADEVETMVGRSAAMKRVFQRARQYARSSAPVLLTGESGTGKEGLARRIHRESARNDKPYARINCAALSEGVLESELFGHERGAFTGAFARRIGRFEWAAGGTLLLDEISEIPLPMQAKLLRVLEEGEFQRVGGNETIATDVRVIATSNRDLEEEIRLGNFRGDLYYRVNVLELKIPPLRLRKEDIPPLTRYFLKRFRHESDVPITDVDDQALEKLCSYQWPGNVRELRNVLHRACVLAHDGTIGLDQLGDLRVRGEESREDCRDVTQMKLEEAERYMIFAALEKHHGNKTAAARDLGVTARTLQNKMRRYRQLGFVA